jgi:histidyl-tRNA synthetase
LVECQVYVIHQGEAGQRRAALLAESIRDQGMNVIVHAGAAGFKAQFRRADASGASFAVILGEDELLAGEASVKWLRAQQGPSEDAQKRVPFELLANYLKDKV